MKEKRPGKTVKIEVRKGGERGRGEEKEEADTFKVKEKNGGEKVKKIKRN